MQLEINPFDRDPRSVPLIRFVLHSTSLTDEILAGDSLANRLVKLNRLKEIKIIPLPAANIDLRKRFTENGLVFTEYSSHESRVVLKVSDGSIHNVTSPFAPRLPQNLWGPIISESRVSLTDLFASDVGDYLVVSRAEPSLKCKVARDSIITAEQALEVVRIILTAHGRFYLSAEEPIEEWLYYLYRTRTIFKAFQYAWTIGAHIQGKGLSEKTYDYLLSLGTRLEFICRAYDKVAFFSLKTAKHDHQNAQLYHLAYFIMLITGVFDDLAHIINEFYHMGINPRTVGLQIERRTTAFYQLLESRNDALHKFLTAQATQRDINAVYSLRDPFQHREWLKGVGLSEFSGDNKNVFELSDETAEELKKISASLAFIIKGNPCFLYPLPFIKWAQEVTIRLVNGVLSSIDWDSVCATLPKDIQDKIKASNEQRFWQLLGCSEEPLYF